MKRKPENFCNFKSFFKVYTVGPDYAHAEARKSPALDGRVERDSRGKEIRYPVILTHKEKQIARTVCLAFKQNVCGFDLLRANGKSVVCDVNGFRSSSSHVFTRTGYTNFFLENLFVLFFY